MSNCAVCGKVPELEYYEVYLRKELHTEGIPTPPLPFNPLMGVLRLIMTVRGPRVFAVTPGRVHYPWNLIIGMSRGEKRAYDLIPVQKSRYGRVAKPQNRSERMLFGKRRTPE
jgi:hypothetical protein